LRHNSEKKRKQGLALSSRQYYFYGFGFHSKLICWDMNGNKKCKYIGFNIEILRSDIYDFNILNVFILSKRII